MEHILNEIGENNMFNVYFYNKRNLLLCQLLQSVPSVGDDLTIKGRKSKVSSVDNLDGKIYVDLIFEPVKKSKSGNDHSKTKKK
ncbi:hypothetical protein [Alkalihalobacterium alkalinitrilicum]|uniref:hypothetical protein n=1 Tax=Alkalihalobacterium alkalinitrilicum TaxID=427920 RepID=UPI001EE41072|nr:hypothetical protein [Alkalihalobacterium alkalinitrilicum]